MESGPARIHQTVSHARAFRAAALAISVVASLVIGLLTVEVWVRASWDPKRGAPGFFLFDPVRTEKLGQDYSGWFAGIPVHLNRLGFRDPREYALAKAPGTFRILVLGDSVAFGHGSVEEHTYPRLLETTLQSRRPGTNWQVWNLGVPGYNTAQELAYLLEVGPAFQPDLVIVGFAANDVMLNRDLRTPSGRERAMTAATNAVRRRVYSLELYRRVYLQWTTQAPPTIDSFLVDDGAVPHPEQQLIRPLHPIVPDEFARTRCARWNVERTADPERADQMLYVAAQADPGLARWKAAVRRLQALHKSGAYRIVFFADVAPAACPAGDGDFFDVRRSRDVNDYYLRILGDGTPAVSPHDAFARYHPSELPFVGAHALGSANLVKAEVLADYLEQQGLLDPGARRPR